MPPVLVVPLDFVPTREGTVELPDGRQLGWAEFGDPDGDPILWFHGTPGGRRQLPPDAPGAASARGVRIIWFDRPGTGRSTPHQYRRVVEVVDDVRVLLDELGIDRLAVAGLSGGGPFALATCWALPDRVVAGAVLGGLAPTRGREHAGGLPQVLPPLEPFLRFVARPLGEVLSLLMRPSRPYMSPIFDLYVAVGPAADRPALRREEVKAVLLADLAESIEGGVRAPLCDLVAFGRHWGFELRDIEVPVVFWHGDADGIVPYHHGGLQAGLVPDGLLVTQNDGGHFSGFGLIGDVLDRVDERRPDRPGLARVEAGGSGDDP